MFNYPGSKYYLARRYPPPFYDTIIEPFAGSAQYAFRYSHKRVILVDLRKDVCALWWRLQRSTPEEILALPTFSDSELIIHDDPAFRLLMMLGTHPGDFNHNRSGTGHHRQRWDNKRKKIADGLCLIRHWEIINDDYSSVANIRATWFVDPPYQFGKSYDCPRLNYYDLSQWCLQRRGQIIVCEQYGADWLPFQNLHKPDLSLDTKYLMGRSHEVFFHRHRFRRNQGDISPVYGHGRYW